MKEFLLSEIGFFPLQLFLMLFDYLLRVTTPAALTWLMFGIPFTRRKWQYMVAAVLTAGFAVASTLLMNGACFYADDWFSMLIAVVLCPFLFELKPKNILKSVVGSLCSEIVGIVKIVLLLFSGFTTDEVLDYSLAFIPEFLSYLLFGAILFGVCVMRVKKKRESSIIQQINVPLFCMIILTVTIFMVSIIVLGVDYTKDVRQFILIFLNMPLFAFTVSYAMKIFMRAKSSEQKYKEMLELQIKHYQSMERKNEELRQFRHDFPKIMRPILLSIQQGNTEEAEQLFNELNISVNATRSAFSTGNIPLDTVLECARQTGFDYGIEIKVGSGSVFPESGIDTRDIYTIFPNALDNAIEACVALGGKAQILFESRMLAGAVYVKISNPCRMDGINSSSPLKTTKRDVQNHGYGTKSIKKAAAKYGENNVSFEAKNGIFTLSIKLEPKVMS